MRVLISGSTGLVGTALSSFLRERGYSVGKLVRTEPSVAGDKVYWNPDESSIDTERLEGYDAVVHLAGENISKGRWTKGKKKRIYRSRVEGTRLLCDALAGLNKPPGTLLCASAVGYYGDRGDEILDEYSEPGEGFLADVCKGWEEATKPAVRRGINVVNMRNGIILSAAGGALRRMLLPFRLGFGGRLGSGEQYVSWISMDDFLGATEHLLTYGKILGPVNMVAPNPVTNREFTKTFGRVLSRPTVSPVPSFVLRAVFGGMADELLLASQRVEPTALLATGYEFCYPELEGALRRVLGRG